MEHAYDGNSGLVGGPAFGAAVAALARARTIEIDALAVACALAPATVARILDGTERVGPRVLASLARALRLRPIEFLQQTDLLSLETYAAGLDPLFFLPAGPIRHDARIYMREINPRHAVPENDMTRRNPTLAALAQDALLDALDKVELELTYLLRTASASMAGRQ
jgi:hypothetical protein